MSGNAQDRRKARRKLERSWTSEPSRFATAATARITTDEYGQRYKGAKVQVMGKADQPGHHIVLSNRRKSPLIVADEHLEKAA
jgi:hypothetical protein